MHSWITLRTGLRNSSTGVPMVMITGPLVDMSSGRLVKNSRLSANALVSSGWAPLSMNGTRPDFKVASVCSLRSLTLSVSPFAANDSTSGIPTWPAPPTTVKSAVLAVTARTAAGRSAMFNTCLPTSDCTGERSHEVGRKQRPKETLSGRFRPPTTAHQIPPFPAEQGPNGDAIDDRSDHGKREQRHLVAQRRPARKQGSDRPLAEQQRCG